MATITSGQTGSFTLDAFGYITVNASSGQGSLSGVSLAQNLKSNVSVSKLASVQYGPYGVPMTFTISCTDGSITYTYTAGYGGSDSTPTGYTLVTGTTHTWEVGTKLYCTNASGCTVTIPDGLTEGDAGSAIQGTGAGPVTVNGTALIPTGTLATSLVGQIIAWERTDSSVSNECVVTGFTPSGPRYLGSYTWTELIAAYPAGGAAITALNSGDWAWCSTFGCRFVPNIAKTRMRPESCFLRLPQVSVGSVATALGTTTSLSNVQWTLTDPQIPAYLLGVGDKLRAYMVTDKTGANATSENKIYLSTADDLTGANLINIASGAPANDFRIAVELDIVSTTLGVATRSMQINSAGTGNPTDVTINNAVLQYLTCSTQMYSTSDSVKLLSFSGEIEFAP